MSALTEIFKTIVNTEIETTKKYITNENTTIETEEDNYKKNNKV